MTETCRSPQSAAFVLRVHHDAHYACVAERAEAGLDRATQALADAALPEYAQPLRIQTRLIVERGGFAAERQRRAPHM